MSIALVVLIFCISYVTNLALRLQDFDNLYYLLTFDASTYSERNVLKRGRQTAVNMCD